jgi:hypothetical protein
MKQTTKRTSPKLWLTLARLTYLVLFAAGIYLTIAGLPWQLEPETYICTQEPCRFETVSPAELQPLEQYGLTPELYIRYRFWTDSPPILTLFFCVSLVIFWLRPTERIGMLTAIFLLTFPTAIYIGGSISPSPAWELPYWLWMAIGGVSLVVLFCVFPDGRFVPGWTRWLALTALVWSIGQRVFQVLAPGWLILPIVELLTGAWVYFSLLVLAFLSQIYRYRWVSGPIQRQQTKWVITAAIMMPLSDLGIRSLLNNLLPFANHPGPGRVIHYIITIPIFRTIPFMMVPIAFAFAILRYRLWDIDILIRRTLQYSLLTSLLGGLYISSVLLLQTTFNTLGRQPSAITTVISTLVIAALFTPLRRKVQAFIDRRFYRRKYNAEQALARFALIARGEVDLNRLTDSLREVVEETMAPESFHLILYPSRRLTRP